MDWIEVFLYLAGSLFKFVHFTNSSSARYYLPSIHKKQDTILYHSSLAVVQTF